MGALFDTPIFVPPQSAILGTGIIVKRPVVLTNEDGGEVIAIRSMMYCCRPRTRAGSRYGLNLDGRCGSAARNAAWAGVSSAALQPKYSRLALSTPITLFVVPTLLVGIRGRNYRLRRA